jgi:hypothetical protein
MSLIKDSTWELISKYIWADLADHKWSDFYLSISETDSPDVSIEPVLIENVTSDIDIDAADVTVNPVLMETSKINIDNPIPYINILGVNIKYNQVIIQTRVEMIVNIITSDRNYLAAMLKYLPQYEKQSTVLTGILNAYASEFIKADQEASMIKNNQFLDTAIEALPVYERELGIKQVNKLDYRQRRERIIAHLRSIAGQTTEEEIKNIAKAYTKGDIELNRTDEPGIFEIKFVGKGIPDNLDSLQEVLDTVIPAHLRLTYNFNYNTWGYVSDLTWADVANITWADIKTFKKKEAV